MLSESRMLTNEIAVRIGRDPDDFEVRNFTGAVFGVLMSAMLVAWENPSLNYLQLVDAGLDHLERGLPL
jgi:CO/xanthine dehydrogenase Mo-binding subunit